METLAEDLNTMVRRPLAETHVAAMRRIGAIRDLEQGAILLKPGDPLDTFLYVEDGELEVLDPIQSRRVGNATLGPTQFFGEVSFLSGGRNLMSLRAVRPSRILEVPRGEMLTLMAQIPEMSDIVVTVFSARRRRLLEEGFGGVTIVGHEDDRTTQDLARFASRNRLPLRVVAPDTDHGREIAEICGVDLSEVRVVIGESEVLDRPTPEALARTLGLELPAQCAAPVDLLVVGAGPAGIAAAVYGASEGLTTLVVEDVALGGQAGTSSRIENYMGFPTGISGADLAWRGEVQAMKFGARFAMPRRAVGLDVLEDCRFKVELDDGAHVRAGAIVIATGVQYRRLPIDRLENFESAGIYYAATELEARYCRDAQIAVIGGGNSAGQAAMFLSRSAKCVNVLVRGPSLSGSMSAYLVTRLENDPGIKIHYNTEMIALSGGDRLDGITIRNKASGASEKIAAQAVFVMVGAAPNTGWLDGHVALDANGFVQTGREAGGGSAYARSTPGIFAVGDVRAGSVKRVASAAGEGSVVVSKVWEHLDAARRAREDAAAPENDAARARPKDTQKAD